MKKSYTFRKFFNDVHLWLGIASGLVLFVVCLSGTVYTFRTDIEEALEPDKYKAEAAANATPLSPDALVYKLGKELKGNVVSLEIPQDKTLAYRVGVAQKQEGGGKGEREGKGAETAAAKKPEGRGGKESKGGHGPAGGGGGRPTTYMVNPYTGAVLGTTEGPATEFFGTVMQLHRWLLIEGGVGKMIVGISTIIFTILVLTGLVLWWPKKIKNWKQGLKVKTDANWKRINHDLHNTFGFYSFLLLLIMSLTGLCWSFDWYREGLSKVMGAEVFKGRREKPLSSMPAADATDLMLADFVAKANTILPYEGNLRVSIPGDDTTAVVITKSEAGFFALAASDKVQLDQHNGQALQVDIFADKPLNEQIVSLIKPLHLGDVYGTFSKILYFLACLIATSLPVTGTLIWINKLRKKKPSKKAPRTTAAQVAG
ncbi:PepSY-associated TM helix domain-containing protein [Pontibacter rugosus]|uniref:PepSY-associated TM helix domain-containing protein n=1 Tax=Pontibacter rugosus TaxID=1745966 RepID=A0ABW3SK13_9BACT